MTTTNAKNRTLPTHEVFDVQDRPNQKSFWNRVGAAFLNRDGSHSVLVYQPGLPTQKRLQLRAIDRAARPLKEGADPKRSPTHELFMVIDVEGAPNEWRRVGVAFTNKDSSLSLIIDDGVRDGPKARFQMRARREPTATLPSPTATGGSAPDSTTAPLTTSTTARSTVVRRRQAA